jgi:hypothetical protein
LDDIAEALGDLLEECVFVGGAVTGFLVTDAAAAPPRVTKDVDLVFDFVSYSDHVHLAERLRAAGFAEDRTEGVICRWRVRGHRVDIMPVRTPNARPRRRRTAGACTWAPARAKCSVQNRTNAPYTSSRAGNEPSHRTGAVSGPRGMRRDFATEADALGDP